jgi:hypothetical protein
MRVESRRCRIEGRDVVVEGDPDTVVKTVSFALPTEEDVVDPVAGGNSEKKVSEG